MKNIKQIIKIVILSVIVGLAVTYVFAAWTGPSADPPASNVAAPINTSGDAQIKTGSLRLGGLTIDQDTYLATLGGNVGIGTSNPQAKLSASFNNSDMLNVYSPGSNALAIQTTLDGQPLGTYGGDNENRLLLQPLVGRVGIGIASPTRSLHVAGATGVLVERADDYPNVNFKGTSGGDYEWLIGMRGAGHQFGIRDVNVNKDRLIIDSIGNVGIGDGTPTSLLHIFSGTVGDNTKGIKFSGPSSSISDIFPTAAGGLIITKEGTGGPEIQLESGNIWLGQSSPGRVGIGTTNPSKKLEVNGDIKLSGASPTYKIINVVNPVDGSDVATKDYVDSVVGAASGGCYTSLPRVNADADACISGFTQQGTFLIATPTGSSTGPTGYCNFAGSLACSSMGQYATFVNKTARVCCK